jgi:hypothetical protein
VPERVVDGFESVQIDHQKRELLVGRPGKLTACRDPHVGLAAVRQAGQRIEVRESIRLGPCTFQRGQVAQESIQIVGLVGACERRGLAKQPD